MAYDTVGSHKTTIYHEGNHTCVKYHATDVVKFNDNEIILNSGGWHTNTTKMRMNQTSRQFGLRFNVYQKDFEWFVDYWYGNGPADYSNEQFQTIEFFDGLTLKRG